MADNGLLDCVVIEPTHPLRGVVLWLHGLGAGADDFVPVVPHLGRPDLRFVFPNAPVRPVTINGGMEMRSWYDICHLDHRPGRNNPDDIAESVDAVRRLLAWQCGLGTPPERVVVAGFSQGGAIALHAVVRHPETLCGGIVLSAYELLPETREAEATAANAATPLFFGHGSNDPTVPVGRGARAAERARAAGHPVEGMTWPMGHEVCLPEIREVARWLGARLPVS